MSLPEDSPPFAQLRTSAENFKDGFDSDISSILAALDSKISALVCDPDSLAGASLDCRRKSNAHVEFSMAKLGVLTHVRNLFEEAGDRWAHSLEDMRAQFLENVESFLSNTKLEVKLPLSPPLKGSLKPAAASKGQSNKSPVSSLYPKLLNTAKSIPGISSFLAKSSEIEESSDEEPQPASIVTPRPGGRTPKRVTISEQYVPSPGLNGSRRRGDTSSINVSMVANYDSEEIEDEIEETVAQTPVKRGRKSAVSTPASAKKGSGDTPAMTEVAKRSLRGGRGAKAASEEPPRRGRTPRKTPKKNDTLINDTINENAMEVSDEDTVEANQKTPKQVHFAPVLDPDDDLEIYSPDVNISRSAPRRKTVVVRAVANFPDLDLTPEIGRAKSKRKTLAGTQLDQTVAPSPKRFKRGRNSIATPSDQNLLESEEEEGNSPWFPLASVGPSVAAQPGVYELKVAAAKKPAYIGSCDNLLQKLSHHKKAEGTGHKHLDKFVERNVASLQVRYQLYADLKEAEREVFQRVKKFMAQHKTTPAYN